MKRWTAFGWLVVSGGLCACASSPSGPSAAGAPPELVVTERGKGGERFTPQAAGGNTIDSKFAGKHRGTPKTSIDPAALEPEFETLADLFDTLPSDQDMQEQFDELVDETGESGARFAESRLPDEQRNVRVRVWLYAVKSESDKDYHVILGSARRKSDSEFMNVEVTGLPKAPSADTPTLRRVREQLRDLLPSGLPGGSRYHKLKKPIAVEVQGSLFYDIDHQPGVVGPMGMRPQTAWEIHPITDLRRGHD